MEKTLLLRFPFKIEAETQTSTFRTPLERKENTLSFSLPFDLNLTAEKGALRLKKPHNTSTIYVFSFASIDDAKAFQENPVLDVAEEGEADCEKLEEEMNSFMAEYESSEKKRKKRVRVYDEDGFYHYK